MKLYDDELIEKLAKKASLEVNSMIEYLESRFKFRTEMHIKLKESYKVKKWTR